MSLNDNDSQPVIITASGAKVVSRETVKMVTAAAFAYLASQLVHSDIALAAIIPLGGFLGVWVYAVVERLHNWRIAKHLAQKLPDDVAVVGRPK